jgi:hypothetical protein
LSLLTGITAAVPSLYVTIRLLESIHDDSNVLPATTYNAARREDGITMPYITAWRGKAQLLDQISSAALEPFAQIGQYLDALVQAMPGSICRLEDDGEGRFLFCFICCLLVRLSVYPSCF